MDTYTSDSDIAQADEKQVQESSAPGETCVAPIATHIATTRPKVPPLQDDWQVGRGLGDCLLAVFQQELLADVTFTFEEGGATVRIRAHRLLLISRSPVFQAMFYGSMPDSSDEIEITDISSDCFRLLLM
jgi:hypothetical protein